MIKINVIILCAGTEEFPRCKDLLEMCPEISILAQPASVTELGDWPVPERNHVQILDEDTLLQIGVDTLRDLQCSHPSIRSLLIIDNDSKNNILPALSLGIQGVLARDTLPLALCRAVAAVYTGEAWVSRRLVEPLRDELICLNEQVHWSRQSPHYPGRDKLN